MAPILVVDDSAFQRNRIKAFLQKEGYSVVQAENGRLGVAAAQQQKFACALVDLAMPELDGIGFLQEVRARNLRLPVVILTADIQKTTRARCMELGALAFMNKPFNEDEMRAALKQAFSLSGSDGQ